MNLKNVSIVAALAGGLVGTVIAGEESERLLELSHAYSLMDSETGLHT